MESFITLVVLGTITFIAVSIVTSQKQKKADREKRNFEEYRRKIEKEKHENAEKDERLRRQCEAFEERRKKERAEYETIRKERENFLSKKRSEFKNGVDSIPTFEITLGNQKHNRNKQIGVDDKEYKNVTKTTSLKKLKDFVAFDTETTGLKTGGNDVIQLSAIKYRDFFAVEKFNTYIKPRRPIPARITEINGITDEMVEDAPLFYQIIDSFNEFIEDLPLVAHNAPFDVKRLYVNGMDSIEEKTVYDTLSLSRRILKGEDSYKLSNICETAQIFMTDAHNAIYDSFAAGELFIYLIATRREITVDDLLEIVNGE